MNPAFPADPGDPMQLQAFLAGILPWSGQILQQGRAVRARMTDGDRFAYDQASSLGVRYWQQAQASLGMGNLTGAYSQLIRMSGDCHALSAATARGSMNFVTNCPAMPVRNTGWGATTPRITDVCVATAKLPLPAGGYPVGGAFEIDIAVVFPQSLVTYRSPGKWQVEALTGDKIVKVYQNVPSPLPGTTDMKRYAAMFFDGTVTALQIGEITFPAEPVVRTGPRTMTAKSIVSTQGQLELPKMLLGKLTITLPDVDADPFPWYQGGQLGGFTVRACACPSEVEWQ